MFRQVRPPHCPPGLRHSTSHSSERTSRGRHHRRTVQSDRASSSTSAMRYPRGLATRMQSAAARTALAIGAAASRTTAAQMGKAFSPVTSCISMACASMSCRRRSKTASWRPDWGSCRSMMRSYALNALLLRNDAGSGTISGCRTRRAAQFSIANVVCPRHLLHPTPGRTTPVGHVVSVGTPTNPERLSGLWMPNPHSLLQEDSR